MFNASAKLCRKFDYDFVLVQSFVVPREDYKSCKKKSLSHSMRASAAVIPLVDLNIPTPPIQAARTTRKIINFIVYVCFAVCLFFISRNRTKIYHFFVRQLVAGSRKSHNYLTEQIHELGPTVRELSSPLPVPASLGFAHPDSLFLWTASPSANITKLTNLIFTRWKTIKVKRIFM